MNFRNPVVNQFGAPSINENTFANRPSAGQPGRIFIATDTALIYRDTGSAWTTLSPAGTSATPGGSNDSFLGSSVQWNNGSGTFGGDTYFLYRNGSVDFAVPKGTFGQIGGQSYGGASTTMTGATLQTAGGGANFDCRGIFSLNSSLTAGSTTGTITLNYMSLTGFYVNNTNSVIIITPYLNMLSTTPFTYNVSSSSSSGISFTITNCGTATIQTNHKFGYVVIN
jgi:hypothetical protein